MQVAVLQLCKRQKISGNRPIKYILPYQIKVPRPLLLFEVVSIPRKDRIIAVTGIAIVTKQDDNMFNLYANSRLSRRDFGLFSHKIATIIEQKKTYKNLKL